MTKTLPGAILASTHYKARLIVTVEGGMVEVKLDVLDPSFDASAIELVRIDLDADGADEDEVLVIDGQDAFVSVGEIYPATDDEARFARAARDAWALA
jgi:hypothetical protein